MIVMHCEDPKQAPLVITSISLEALVELAESYRLQQRLTSSSESAKHQQQAEQPATT